MGDEFPKPKRKTLILVMGLPFTASEWLSSVISRWAKCPWLKHGVILNSLLEESGYHHPDNLPSEEEIARLKRVSFGITCSSARFQLDECAPTEFVIISSDIVSYESQLLGLLNLVQHVQPCRLLIIECLLKNKFLWQRDFESNRSQKEWYHPKGWKDVEKAILVQEGLNAYLLTLLQQQQHQATPPTTRLSVDAIKLVIDPDEDLNTRDVTESDASKLQLRRGSLFAEAIKELLTCDHLGEYGDGSHVVDYRAWRRKRIEELGRTFASRVTTQHHWCEPGDCIFRHTHNPEPDPNQQEATCEICVGNITTTEQAVYCQFCSLSFHQACCCASPTITESSSSELAEVLDSIESEDDEIFAETHACYSCIREEKGFSWSCGSCIYRTTLKTRVLSPILRHPCDPNHILTMRLSRLNINDACKACGRYGDRNAYSCNICGGRDYHMECLHLPQQMDHQHGGHLHRINMEFSCAAKEDEYEWCLYCYKDINPETWVYTCQDCDYVAHLFCVFPFLSRRFRPSFLER